MARAHRQVAQSISTDRIRCYGTFSLAAPSRTARYAMYRTQHVLQLNQPQGDDQSSYASHASQKYRFTLVGGPLLRTPLKLGQKTQSSQRWAPLPRPVRGCILEWPQQDPFFGAK